MILITFLDKTVFDQLVEVGIQSTVVDVIYVVFQFTSDRLTGGLIGASDDIQEVTLEAGQLEGLCVDYCNSEDSLYTIS